MTPDRRTLFALFALAFGLRILYAVVVGSSPDLVATRESYDFQVAAKMATDSHWLTTPFSPNAPGYLVLLGAALKFTRISWWTAIILNALLGSATTLFLYRIGEQRLGPRVGLAAALWLGVMVSQMQFASVVQRDTLVTFLFVWFVYSIIRPFQRMRNALWSAVLYIALTYTEPLFLWLLPLVVVYLAMGSTHHRALSIQYVFLFVTTFLLLNVPWTIRNYAVHHDIVPISLEATRYGAPIAHVLRRHREAPPPEATTVRRPGFAHESMEFWRVVRLADAPADAEHGLAPQPAWSFRHNAINVVNFGVLLPLFVCGVVAAWRRRHRVALVLAGAIVAWAVVRGFYGGADRARLPVEPLIILVAFFGAKVLLDARRQAGTIPTPTL